MLQIRLLGQFDVRLDGKRIVVPSRASQSLLAYLSMTAGTPHRREKLAGTIWPDSSEENARKNLRQELWRIRKAIPVQSLPQADDYLIADEYTLTFNREADYWLEDGDTLLTGPVVDQAALHGLLRKVRASLNPGGRAAALEFVPNEDRVTPPMAASFSLMMLATTVSGDAYTFSELAAMYREADLDSVSAHPVPNGPHTIVIGSAA